MVGGARIGVVESFDELKSRADSLLPRAKSLRDALSRPASPGQAVLAGLLSDASRTAIKGVGGGLSEAVLGSRAYGSRAGARWFAAVSKQSRNRAAGQSLDAALALVREFESIVAGLEDPVDWRLARRQRTELARARTAQRPTTVLDRLIRAIEEFRVYSPPDDAISVVRRLDVAIRACIRTRLGAIDPDWWNTRIPSAIRTRAEARMRARKSGPADPLLFLQFSDYCPVFTTKANWEATFGATFGELTEVELRFRELTLLRNDVVHGRPITTEARIRLRDLSWGLIATLGRPPDKL